MAFNPPISLNGTPLRLDGEYLMLERKNIEGEFKIPAIGKKSAKGKLFITTARMVFVNSEFAKSDFKSFDIPLAFLFNEKFEQPIFGSNYLAGAVHPLYNLLPGDVTFKLWFTSGGCQTFLNCFCQLVDQIRKSNDRRPDNRFIENVRFGRFAGQKGFVDPDDPSVIYVEQPQETYNQVFNNNNNNNFYGQNYANAPQPVLIGSNDPNINKNLNQQPVQQQNFSNQMNFQQPPPQNFGFPPQGNYQQFPDQNLQQPPIQPGINNAGFDYPQLNENQLYNNGGVQQQPPIQQPIPQSQPQPQPQLNVGYYYGFGLGPQLKKNN